MERQTITQQYDDIKQFPNRAILFTSYITTEVQKKYFLSLLEYVKTHCENSLIVLSSHLSVDDEILNYVDTFIFSKNNPAVNRQCKTHESMNRFVTVFSFPENEEWDLHLHRPYIQHAYAHHLNKYDGLQYLKSQRIEYAHVLNYDLQIEKLKELNNQYSLMKDDGYDLIYYDCDTWLGKDAMNTELFSVRTSACSDKLLNILSFQEYDNATDVVHEKTYLNLFDNKKKFNYGSVNKTMGYFRFDDEKDTNELKDIDLINTVIMTNVMFYLFTLKNNVLNKCTIDNEFYDSLDVTDSILIMHNQTENNINVNYLFYDENFVEINFVKNVIGNGTFNYYNVSNDVRYCKVRVNDKDKSFFDIRDSRNYATVVRSERIRA